MCSVLEGGRCLGTHSGQFLKVPVPIGPGRVPGPRSGAQLGVLVLPVRRDLGLLPSSV